MNNPGGMSPENWQDIGAVQAEITRWAQATFPHRTDHHAIYKLMVEEIPELAMHKKENGTDGIGPELADCFILLLDLASLWGVDVADAIETKMRINYARTWNKDPDTGIMQHVNQKMAPEVTWPKIDFTSAEEQRKSMTGITSAMLGEQVKTPAQLAADQNRTICTHNTEPGATDICRNYPDCQCGIEDGIPF